MEIGNCIKSWSLVHSFVGVTSHGTVVWAGPRLHSALMRCDRVSAQRRWDTNTISWFPYFMPRLTSILEYCDTVILEYIFLLRLLKACFISWSVSLAGHELCAEAAPCRAGVNVECCRSRWLLSRVNILKLGKSISGKSLVVEVGDLTTNPMGSGWLRWPTIKVPVVDADGPFVHTCLSVGFACFTSHTDPWLYLQLEAWCTKFVP